MDKRQILNTLVVMRHQIAAIGTQVEALIEALERESACSHPNMIEDGEFGSDYINLECPDCGYTGKKRVEEVS